MRIYTIGFTHKSAEEFFTKLSSSGVRTLIDIRINRTSQLSGFSKEGDLKYFLRSICDIDYIVREDLAPTKQLLKSYRDKELIWSQFESSYLDLLTKRNVLRSLKPELFEKSVLLCSEAEPERCHRRLLAEAILDLWEGVEIIHL